MHPDLLTPRNESLYAMGGMELIQYIVARFEQPWKAENSILVTLFGIVIDVRLEQPAKAPIPIIETLLGIVIDVSPEQPAKTSPPMYVTLLGMVIEERLVQK